MASLQVNDPRSRGRSKSPGGRIREHSRSRDDRGASRSPAPPTSRSGKKYYDSDSAEEGDRRREKQRESQYSSRSGRTTTSSKYDDISDSDEERYRAKERTKDRYYHSESDSSDTKRKKRSSQYASSGSNIPPSSSRNKDEEDKDRAYRASGAHGRSHSSLYDSESGTESDSDISALAYGDAPSHVKASHLSSQDPRSSRESISSKLTSKIGAAYDRVSNPGQYSGYQQQQQQQHQQHQQPNIAPQGVAHGHPQPGQYVDPRLHQGHYGAGQIPPVLPPDWAPIPPSEMPGYVPPSTHAPTSQSIPGAFPGGYPATSMPPTSNAYSPGYTSTQSYANPGVFAYANPDPNVRYTSKNERQPYTASTQNQYDPKPAAYTASAEPQFLDIAPGRSRAESIGRQGRPHSLSVSSNLSVGGGMMSPAGGRPPASPLLEAYKGTYQSMSPMPSPMHNPTGLAHDSDISDLEGLGGSGSDRRRKHKSSRSKDERREREKERERDSDKDRKRHSRRVSRQGEEVITIAPGGARDRKKVMFYDPVPDAVALKDALSRHSSLDSRPLIEILPHLTSDEILTLRQEYKNHAKVQGKGINIAKHIKLKLGNSSFGKVCYATALGRWESEAYWANCYYQAGTSRRELLIESLIGRSNGEIREIKSCFRDARYADSLEKCMKAELKADKFRSAILLALSEQRQLEKEQIDVRLVQQDVVDLRRAVVAREGGETAMINIILLRSDSHLREVMRAYDHNYKANFAKEVIKKSQNLVGETLVHVLNGAINRPMRDALLLHQAIRESHSSKERSELLISRLVRLHWEPRHLELVKEEYQYRYKERVEEGIAQEIITSSGGSEWGEFCIELVRSSRGLANRT